MGDARLKAVLPTLIDLSTRTAYISDILNDLRQPLGKGDMIEIPAADAITVVDSGSTDTAPQTVGVAVTTLNANLDPAAFVDLPVVSTIQLLGGGWKDQMAVKMLVAVKNKVDTDIIKYAGSIAYESTGLLYTDNPAASAATIQPTITLPVVNNCVAALESIEGCNFAKLAWFIHPFAKAAISSVSAFSPIIRDGMQKGFYGVPQIGWLNEIPVYISQGVQRRRAVTATAWAITGTTTETITVAAGHNIVPGMVISFNTVTAGGKILVGLTVTSVTATTIVCTSTGLTNASATEAGTITIEACENLLVDTEHFHVAEQLAPTVRIVPAERRTSDVAQVTKVYGRVARAGRVRTLLTGTRAA